MSITVKTIKCPECGATLQIEEDRSQLYCSYCGTPIIITNENEHIIRYVDEAEIIKAETNKMVSLNEINKEERNMFNVKILAMVWGASTGILILITILLVILSLNNKGYEIAIMIMLMITGTVGIYGGVLVFDEIPKKQEEKEKIRQGGIRFPRNLEPFQGKDIKNVEYALRSAGFYNIICINKHDLTLGLMIRHGTIESLSVNGIVGSPSGKIYMPDIPITIVYHGR